MLTILVGVAISSSIRNYEPPFLLTCDLQRSLPLASLRLRAGRAVHSSPTFAAQRSKGDLMRLRRRNRLPEMLLHGYQCVVNILGRDAVVGDHAHDGVAGVD